MERVGVAGGAEVLGVELVVGEGNGGVGHVAVGLEGDRVGGDGVGALHVAEVVAGGLDERISEADVVDLPGREGVGGAWEQVVVDSDVHAVVVDVGEEAEAVGEIVAGDGDRCGVLALRGEPAGLGEVDVGDAHGFEEGEAVANEVVGDGEQCGLGGLEREPVVDVVAVVRDGAADDGVDELEGLAEVARGDVEVVHADAVEGEAAERDVGQREVVVDRADEVQRDVGVVDVLEDEREGEVLHVPVHGADDGVPVVEEPVGAALEAADDPDGLCGLAALV